MTRVAAALLLFISTGSASAETTWDVLQQFGLTGVWAASCDRPSTRLNFFEIYSKDPGGLARREVDRGAEIPIALSFIDSAQIISPSMLKARIRNADPNWGPLNNLTYNVIAAKEIDPSTKEIIRFRFVEAVRSDGDVIAKGGTSNRHGKAVYWQYKCRSTMSALLLARPAD